VLEPGGVYGYPTLGGDTINPYMSPKHFDRAAWSPDGFGLMLVLGRGRAFDYLAWYQVVTSRDVVTSIPDRTTLVGEIRWGLPIYGTCNPAHFRKMELAQLGVFPIDSARIDHFYPHMAQGTIQAVRDISIANNMEIRSRPHEPNHRWRRPDGKLERIVYPPRPTLAELTGSAA
jgi:hypothetical protein